MPSNTSNYLEFYGQYVLTAGMKMLGIGPLWFALALLIFSIIYAMLRTIFPVDGTNRTASGVAIAGVLYVLLAIIAAGAFFIRLFFPIGSILLTFPLILYTTTKCF